MWQSLYGVKRFGKRECGRACVVLRGLERGNAAEPVWHTDLGISKPGLKKLNVGTLKKKQIHFLKYVLNG